MANFVLVHGAWHGAWCWTYVEAALRRLGHQVATVDLPCDDPAATFTTYADVVAQSTDGLDDIVLVGHSLAGLTIPLVPRLRPVRQMVFLCALIPSPGRSVIDQAVVEPEMLIGDVDTGADLDELGRHRWVDAQPAGELLFHDCDDAGWAFDRLRPQGTATYAEPCPLDSLPDTPRTYILCREDRLVNPTWSRGAAPARLGVDAIELAGGHSPFLSRPAELAQLLHDAAGVAT